VSTTTTSRSTHCHICLDPNIPLDVLFGHECSRDLRTGHRPLQPNARRSTDTSGRSGQGGNGPAATEAQVRYLVKLGMAEADAQRLGKKAASDEIDKRLAAAKPAEADTRRPNRYAGRCVRCGAEVAAEAGYLAKDASGRWAADHKGACPERTVPAAPAPTAEPAPELPGADVVPAGSYALDGTDDAKNATVFYEVDRPTKGRWAGHVFVSLVVGGQANRNMRRDQVPGILARIVAAGPQQAMARFGHELGQCGVCHRHLTDDDSRARGIGPVCAAALGW
jgi:hypothetical protein